jgi:disulfide bond formation protein DsbB
VDASQVADLEGTAATAGVVVLVALVVLRVVAPARFAAVRRGVAGNGLLLAGGVAVLAMAGSLWFSEGNHFPPCKFCWYQRIAMYPLAVLLPIAAWRRDSAMRSYGVVLAGLGLAVSAYHNYIETFPDAGHGGCDPTNPCTIRWVEGLGFWTIPRMAAVCFALIIAALLLDRPLPPEETSTP